MIEGGWTSVAFWIFAPLAALPGLGILFARNIIHAAFFLLASLIGFAGLYIVIGADFLAFTQLLVYVGGILVLILFGVMLTQKDPLLVRRTKHLTSVGPGLVTFLLIGGVAMGVVWTTDWQGEGMEKIKAAAAAAAAERAERELAKADEAGGETPAVEAPEGAEPSEGAEQPAGTEPSEGDEPGEESKPGEKEDGERGTTTRIGELFMTRYILPFEVISVLILAALIGAVYIARGKDVEE